MLVKALSKRNMDELETQVRMHGGKMKKTTQGKSMNVVDDWDALKRSGIAKDK
jgi:hypothetical protein